MIHTDALRGHIVSDINIFVKVRHLFAGFGTVFVLVFLASSGISARDICSFKKI